MGWDKKHYKEIFKWVYSQLGGGLNPEIYTSLEKPVWNGDIFISMLPDIIHREDWEGAQATKDALIKWYNEHLPPGESPLTEEALIRIPAYQEHPACGYHLSLGKPDDPSGIASGGCINGCM